MSTDTVTTFLALLALGVMVVTLGLAVAVVEAVRSGGGESAGGGVLAAVAENATVLSLIAVVVATAGSLYMSEVAHFIPCRLCWYQRIAMYPLVVVFALALIRREPRAGIYGLVLAIPGIAISFYHILVERFPSLESGACDPTNPCSLKWVEWFGFVTIPVMAASAFAFVIAVQAIRIWHSRGEPQ